MTKGGSVILRIYFALVAFVTLMILIFSTGDLLNIGLKTWVFTAADAPTYVTPCATTPVGGSGTPPTPAEVQTCQQQQASDAEAALVQKEQDAVRDLSLLIISLPLFIIHFRIVYRDWTDERTERKDDDKKSEPKKV